MYVHCLKYGTSCEPLYKMVIRVVFVRKRRCDFIYQTSKYIENWPRYDSEWFPYSKEMPNWRTRSARRTKHRTIKDDVTHCHLFWMRECLVSLYQHGAHLAYLHGEMQLPMGGVLVTIQKMNSVQKINSIWYDLLLYLSLVCMPDPLESF